MQPPSPTPWYAPTVVTAAKAWWWYQANVNERLHQLEIDRFWTQPPIQVGAYGDPISNEGLKLRVDTYFATLETNLQLSGRITFGDPRTKARIDQSRITAKFGQSEIYSDWQTGQFGVVAKLPMVTVSQGDYTLGTAAKLEYAGRPALPNYELGAALKGEIKGVLPGPNTDMTVQLEPAWTVKGTFRGGPTAAAVAVGGVLIAPALPAPAIILPLVERQPAYGF